MREEEYSFVFGQAVWGNCFAGRKWFIERLVSKLTSLNNIILISPRGWGKTSVVYKVGNIITDSHFGFRTCYIDLQNVHSEEEFLDIFTRELYSLEERIFPIRNSHNHRVRDILNLPESIAIRDRIKLIVFIGNIQKIALFRNSLQFQKKLYLVWKLHRYCAYCLYGNKQQVSRDLLDSPYKPLNRFCKTFSMPGIEPDEFSRFIQKRFQYTGKHISKNLATMITFHANCIPNYVQLLAWHAWIRTKNTCTHQNIEDAIKHLTLHFSLNYQALTESLTTKQVSYLEAVICNNDRICSQENLQKYNLGTSANVARIKMSLKNKELIETHLEGTILLDPFYRNWLKQYYFRV